MGSSWLAVILLSVLGTACADEPPIIGVIREMLYETNQELAKNHQDHLALPNLGILIWDPIKLRNGSLGVFSTVELVGEQNATQNDKPDGAMELILDLNIGLGTISLQYDFHINVLGLYVQSGVALLTTSSDTARANVTVTISKDGKCSATLNSAIVTELDNFKIELQPNYIPNLTLISQALVNFLTPKSLPLVNLVISQAVGTDFVQKQFSERLCKKLPL